MKGRKFSEESLKRLSEAHIGQVPWNKGLKMNLSPERIQMLRERVRGRKNSWWKGGITSLGKRIRNLLEYREWKVAVYKKESSTCHVCGCSKHIGHAHHLRPFYKILSEFLYTYKEYDPMKDVDVLERLAMTFEPFWDVDNGIVLCPTCHSSIKH